MRLSSIVASVIVTTAVTASTAFAGDCGQPPIKGPGLVPFSDGMSVETVTGMRDAVLRYSTRVDTYITCMDREGEKLIAFMGKKQQSRREEDLNAIHETRRQIQVKMNDLIRAYRASLTAQ